MKDHRKVVRFYINPIYVQQNDLVISAGNLTPDRTVKVGGRAVNKNCTHLSFGYGEILKPVTFLG